MNQQELANAQAPATPREGARFGWVFRCFQWIFATYWLVRTQNEAILQRLDHLEELIIASAGTPAQVEKLIALRAQLKTSRLALQAALKAAPTEKR